MSGVVLKSGEPNDSLKKELKAHVRKEIGALAVPDDVLPGLVSGLVDDGAIHAGQFVVHPSGRHGIDVLAPAAQAGAVRCDICVTGL